MAGLAISTFGDLITLALKNAGIIGVGQTPAAEDMNDAAQLLNLILAEWQRLRYLVYHLVEQSVSCTGAQSYSLGPGGDFSMTSRPSIVNYAFARQVIDSNPNQIDYPIQILPSRETYARIAMKSLQSFPQWAWYDADFPLANLLVYPVITSQFSLFIGYPALLQSVDSLTTTINMPPEYAGGLMYNLAVDLAGAYQLTPNPRVVAKASYFLQTMRVANAQIPQMTMPRILNNGARYNIFSDRAGPGNY